MKSFTAVAATAALAGVASAKVCRDITVPVTISARNAVFDKAALTPADNTDVTNFVLNSVAQGGNYTGEILKGYATVKGSYKLATTYCHPDKGTPDIVQLLTHGIGFDRTYWDASYNNGNYSYVNEAVDHYGYATLAWDRLGIAQSSHGEPVNEIQAQLEVAALAALTQDLRNGKVAGAPAFKKVVHVGHSFGSEHTYLLTAKYPKISDGIVLTGFSQNGSFVPFFELGGNFVQANGNPSFLTYPNGYLAAGDPSAVQTNFFAPGDFDPKIVQYAYRTGQPVTIGELLTIGGESATPNTFAGPVLIVTGERDIPFCGGNCLSAPPGLANIPSSSKSFFKKASKFEVVIVPGAGHGLNLQYSHTYTYGKILDFFAQNGLAASPSTSASPSGYPKPTPYGY